MDGERSSRLRNPQGSARLASCQSAGQPCPGSDGRAAGQPRPAAPAAQPVTEHLGLANPHPYPIANPSPDPNPIPSPNLNLALTLTLTRLPPPSPSPSLISGIANLGGPPARSKCSLASAPARLLRLLRARLEALGSSALPGRGRPTVRPATASGARASRLHSPAHSTALTVQVLNAVMNATEGLLCKLQVRARLELG